MAEHSGEDTESALINPLEESFHEVEVTSEKPQPVCTYCGKQFSTNWGLKRHETTHQKTHKLQCSLCNLTFSTRGYYEGHVNMHHRVRPHVCSKCNSRYAYRSSLLRHAVQCKGPSQPAGKEKDTFKCDACGQCFTRKDILRDHIHGKHEGAARYTCSKCAQLFRWRSSYNRHVNSCSFENRE